MSRKLKDLFVSSPPLEDKEKKTNSSNHRDGGSEIGLLPVTGSVGGGSGCSLAARRGGASGALRPVSATFRYRLLRRAWRPVLVTIPE